MTENQNLNDNPNQEANPNKKVYVVGGVIIAALLVLCLTLATFLIKANNENEFMEQNNMTLTEDNESLDQQIKDLEVEFEELLAENNEVKSLNDEQMAELEAKKAEIEELYRYKKDYRRAKQKLDALKVEVNGYLAEIALLKEENSKLTDENMVLNSDLEQERTVNTELAEAKAMLTAEKEELSSKNSGLSKTVRFASVIKVENIVATGFRSKGNGKMVDQKKAKNIEVLELCFETTVNEVTNAGSEDFQIRIITPQGETIANDSKGSGILTNQRNKEQIRYTAVKTYDYANDKTNLCINWKPDGVFDAGTYAVEVYNKGYLCGIGSFTLK